MDRAETTGTTAGQAIDADPVLPPTAAVPSPPSPPRGSRGCGSVMLGALLVFLGIPMLICPGPGVAVILAGLGMIGVGLGIKSGGE